VCAAAAKERKVLNEKEDQIAISEIVKSAKELLDENKRVLLISHHIAIKI
jgi:hypothetical protein